MTQKTLSKQRFLPNGFERITNGSQGAHITLSKAKLTVGRNAFPKPRSILNILPTLGNIPSKTELLKLLDVAVMLFFVKQKQIKQKQMK